MAKSGKTQAEIYREQRKARLAKAAKKREKGKMSAGAKKVIAVFVAIVIVAGIGTGVFFSKGINYRFTKAIAIEGIGEINADEFSFYYNSLYNNYCNYAKQYDESYGSGYGAMYLGGFDYSQVPDQQSYTSGLDGYDNPTWADYFFETTKESVMSIKAMNKLAIEAGVSLTDEDYVTIEENISSLKSEAKSSGFSFGQYIKLVYGKSVTEKLFKKLVEEQQLTTRYQEVMQKQYNDEITDKQINKTYKEDKSAYDVASVVFYLVNAETVESTSEDGETTTAVTKKTMKKAKAQADEIALSSDADSFKKACDELAGSKDSATVIDNKGKSDLSSYASSEISEWIFGGAKKGETKVIESEDTGYYVALCTEAQHRDDTDSINVRHILIKLEDDTASSSSNTEEVTDEATEEVTEEAVEEETAEEPELAMVGAENVSVEDDTQVSDEELEVAAVGEDGEDDAKSADVTEENSEETTEETTETTTEPIKVTALADLKKQYSDVSIDSSVDENTATNLEKYAKAMTILEEYLAGDKTEDSFGALAKEYTGDSNGDEGGLYENVIPGQMVQTFNDWCFDESRKAGDVGIVETSYGYHIMYFVGTNENLPGWKITIKDSISSEKLNTYLTDEISLEKFPVTVLNQSILDKVISDTMKFAEKQIAISAQSSSYSY